MYFVFGKESRRGECTWDETHTRSKTIGKRHKIDDELKSVDLEVFQYWNVV